MRSALVLVAAFIMGVPLCAMPVRAAERSAQAVQRIDGLRVCADGGLALPGSNTCVRLSGTLDADTVLRTPRQPTLGAVHGMTVREHLRGEMAVDVRAPTELGPVRVYTSVRVNAAPDPDVLHR